MKNWAMLLVGVALMLGALAAIWSPLTTFLAVDGCLDAGGSFDYAVGDCDFENAHPYEPRDSTTRLVLALLLAIAGVVVTAVARYGRRKV